ncbi:DNA polymerase III subunit alpha [Phenylobacterium sp.]|uniref:DNA polymerase III subunit alpha n=1 Tax=Phenylobacterium sp. TaxID=1871053 RepID=UPI0025D1F2E2|nr:DNA polymerase III subunit alpha [Phenylobacterium sp.]MCA6285686.1 DNA polymerase III subunit alpha [Phenylobacterium sp.]MCA6309965.1 DNA polymerase III subunit alpha [Phenylobacterium sp.]MCA6322553.1 DNA polymerase III subunit alpha [Phenylobacterium sp.]MCA6335925.1 DNA polymerase III subunit alpha [Phenylobacterium sp.]MCA6338670.1 DNA polymerase III subunit alpha [Phenylobacterium sp.]
MTAETGFIHLRVRSAYSLLEGAAKADALGRIAAGQGMPAVAIADRANLFGALEFSVTAKEEGVQPIIGCALPVTGIGGRAPERWARTPTIVLLAQSEAGYLNLSALSSMAFLEADGVEEPSAPWSEVVARSEGLILLSGGSDGPVDPLFAAGRVAEGQAALAAMAEAFGDRFYIELQRHGLASQAAAEPGLVAYAYAHDLPLVATNDVCFPTADLYAAHEALLCIADGAFIGQEERRRVTPEHWFKPAAAMRALFADLPEACDNTIDIARRCAFMVKKRDPILPRFPTSEGRTEDEELASQAWEGLQARLALHPLAVPLEAYEARLEQEIGVIQKMGFSGYFLIVSDFMKWAVAQGIPVGPGRGSGASSLVAWSLLITGLDPLRYGLVFERFLNPERVSMPDFDIDFCQERREEVIAYVQQRYGRDRVAQIITFGTLQARAVLRDVGRVLQMPLGQVDRLAKMVPANPANPVTLARAIELEPRLRQAQEEDESVARLLEIALKLEGLYRNASTHAAGVVIADRPLTELSPLYRDPRSDLPATQFNMKWVESAGLVKFDFLGLKTLTVIDRAMKHLARRGADFPLEGLALDDAATYELMASGQTVGVFQLEGQGMRDTLRQLRPGSIEEVTALISLYRPGPMDSIPAYVDTKAGRKPLNVYHPLLEPVLTETYGVIVYQEQVMNIARIMAGYSLGEADLLRRAMGKKKKEEMDQQRARFLSGAAERGVDPDLADTLFELMAKFSGYGFNKGHAAPYALIGYQTAWLKANAPVEFFAASMSLDISNTDKLAVFYQDARRFGVTIRPPDVNRSGADFDVGDGEVLYALGGIRNVGLQAMEHVVEVRAASGPFRDIFDFVERVDPRHVNRRTLETLARAGAFDSLGCDRAQLVEASEVLAGYGHSVAEERASSQGSLFGGDQVEAQRPRLPRIETWSPSRRLDEELAAVGFYLSGHPLDDLMPALRRRRTDLLTEVIPKAEAGAEAFRMAGVVRRRQERASQASGDKFAFVTLSDPSGEYEVLFPPESLRRCRDLLEPGRAVSLKVRAKARDGEVRFFGDDAEPVEVAIENAVAGLRVHVSPRSLAIDALKARLTAAPQGRGGEIVLVAPVEGGREIEVRLPGRFDLSPAVRGALKTAPGVVFVEDV